MKKFCIALLVLPGRDDSCLAVIVHQRLHYEGRYTPYLVRFSRPIPDRGCCGVGVAPLARGTPLDLVFDVFSHGILHIFALSVFRRLFLMPIPSNGRLVEVD